MKPTRQACPRCLKLRDRFVRVAFPIFKLYAGKLLCLLCVEEVLRQIVERLPGGGA